MVWATVPTCFWKLLIPPAAFQVRQLDHVLARDVETCASAVVRLPVSDHRAMTVDLAAGDR